MPSASMNENKFQVEQPEVARVGEDSQSKTKGIQGH